MAVVKIFINFAAGFMVLFFKKDSKEKLMKKLFGLLLLLLAVSSCKEDADMIIRTPQRIHLYPGEQKQIEAESSLKIQYSSLNDYFATVDENGMVTARYVGDTQVRLSTTACTEFIQVSVVPRYTLYVEPYYEFPSTRYAVEKMYGEPFKEEDNCLVYETLDVEASKYFYFCFDDEDNLLASVATIAEGNEEELGKFLAERYVTVSQEDWTYRNTLEVTDETVEIRSFYSEKYGSRVVVYAPYGTDFDTFKTFAEPLKYCKK